jgi:hypothetical protein
MSDLFEAVFVASDVREADLAERALQESAIEFRQRLDAVPHETSAVCYLGTMFEVAAQDAERSREALKRNGLINGLVPAK